MTTFMKEKDNNKENKNGYKLYLLLQKYNFGSDNVKDPNNGIYQVSDTFEINVKFNGRYTHLYLLEHKQDNTIEQLYKKIILSGKVKNIEHGINEGLEWSGNC